MADKKVDQAEEIVEVEPHKPTMKDFKSVTAENDALRDTIQRLRDRFTEVATFLDSEDLAKAEKEHLEKSA